MAGISRQKLLNWALLKRVYREELIDKNIAKINLPSDLKMEDTVEQWLKNNGIQSNDLLQKWLIENGLDIEQWKNFVLRDYKWRKWCRDNFDKDLSSYYLKRKPLLDKVTYSLLRVKDEDLAFELYMRLLEDEEDFGKLANQYSEGPEAQSKGLIGPVTLKQTHPLLAKLLLISEENQLWPPKKIDEWWIVVRLEKTYNTEFNEEIKSFLAFELGEQFLTKEFNSIKKNLTNKNNKSE